MFHLNLKPQAILTITLILSVLITSNPTTFVLAQEASRSAAQSQTTQDVLSPTPTSMVSSKENVASPTPIPTVPIQPSPTIPAQESLSPTGLPTPTKQLEVPTTTPAEKPDFFLSPTPSSSSLTTPTTTPTLTPQVTPNLTGSPQSLDSAKIRQPAKILPLLKHHYLANEGITARVINLEGPNTKTTLIYADGEEVSIPIYKDVIGEEMVLRISPTSNLKPGKYTLKVTDSKGQELTQDFTWGVLAINTNKSIYLVGEEAYLQMAALNDNGRTLCNTNLKLQVSQPDGAIVEFKTEDQTIKKSGDCRQDNVTDKPDYFVNYVVNENGVYRLKLSNLDKGYEITDTFEVKENLAFSIERIGATRINPFLSNYRMTFNIKASRDFDGTVIEKLPSGFEVIDAGGGITEKTAAKNGITWKINLKKDQQTTLRYEYKAPEISPQLYLLGPLTIQPFDHSTILFQESRQWQIAADAACNATVGGTWGGTDTATFVGCTGAADTSSPDGGARPGPDDDLTINDGINITLSVDAIINSLVICDNACAADTDLTHADSTIDLTVNATVYIWGGAGANINSIWYISAGTGTVSGLITLDPQATNANRDARISVSTGTLNANGGITFDATAGMIDNQLLIVSSGTINFKGAFTNLSNADNRFAAGGTFNYADTSAAQTIRFDGAAPTYYNLKINNTHASGATLEAAISSTTNMVGNLRVGDGSNAALFKNGGFGIDLTSNMTFEVKNGAFFEMSGTSTFPSSTGFIYYTFGATSTIRYLQTAATAIVATTYGNLELKPSANSITFTFATGSPVVAGNLTTGVNGLFTGAIITAAANSTILDVNGDVTIGANSTLVAHASNSFTVGGSWTNNNLFTDSGGTVTFDATTPSKTLSGTMNTATTDFSKVDFNGSGGGWTIQSAMKVNDTTANAFKVSAGTVTLGDGTGTDDLEVDGKFTVSSGATFNTISTLAQGSTITININGTAAPSCTNCTIDCSGTMTISENVTLMFNSGDSVQSGIDVSDTGNLTIQGEKYPSGAGSYTSTTGTDEGTTTDYLYVGNQGWTDDIYNNMTARMTSGLAFGRLYSITDTLPNSNNNYITFAGTAGTTDTGATTISTNGKWTRFTTSVSLITTDNQDVGRYLHDITAGKWFLITDTTNNGSNDYIDVVNDPDSFTGIANGDDIEIVDGIKVDDTFEVLDYALVSAHLTNHGYINGSSDSQITIQYADISELGAETIDKFSISSAANAYNVTASFTVNKSKIYNNYYGLRISSTLGTISNNAIYSSAAMGIRIDGPLNTISYNRVYSSTSCNVCGFSGGRGSVVYNNYFYSGSSIGTGGSPNGVLFYSNVTYSNAGGEGNVFIQEGDACIYHAGKSFNSADGIFPTDYVNIVSNNDFYFNSGAGIYTWNNDPGSVYFNNESYKNGVYGYVQRGNTGADTGLLYNEEYGSNGGNTTADITTDPGSAQQLQVINTTLNSTTEVTGISDSGDYVISKKHDGTSGITKVWGNYSTPADSSETPNNEAADKFNYEENLWEDSATPHGYAGGGTEDTDIGITFTSALTQAEWYRATLTTLATNGGTFTIYRSGSSNSDFTASPSTYDITSGAYTESSTGIRFTIQDGAVDYALGDTYIFFVFPKSDDTYNQKTVTMQQTADSLTVGSGKTIELLGTSSLPTLVQKVAGATSYGFSVTGTINANQYRITGTDASGLNLGTGATVTNLSNGTFDDSGGVGASDTYITVVASILDGGAKSWTGMVFDDGATDSNVNYNATLSGTPSSCSNSWTFYSSGNKGGATNGEANDSDVDADCSGVGYLLWQNTGNISTLLSAWSFQRKTFYDTTNSIFWRFYYDGSKIKVEYSSNGTSWTADTVLSEDTNDFSIWDDNTYVYLAYADKNDIRVRRGTLGVSSIDWGSEYVAIDGTGATASYSYAYIGQDSAGYLWVTARYYNGTYYYMQAIRSDKTTDVSPTSGDTWTETVNNVSSTSNTNSNVYGVIVSLNTTSDMYLIFNRAGSNVEGCRWDNDHSGGARWENSSDQACPTNVDSIGTGITGLDKTLSATTDSEKDVHAIWIDNNSYVQHKKYDESVPSWGSATRVDNGSAVANTYPTISFDSTGNNLYTLYIRDSVIYYNLWAQGSSPNSANETTPSNPSWTPGTNPSYLTSNYADPGKIFAKWTSGSAAPYTVNWNSLTIAASGPTLDQLLRHGAWFSSGVKQPFTF